MLQWLFSGPMASDAVTSSLSAVLKNREEASAQKMEINVCEGGKKQEHREKEEG